MLSGTSGAPSLLAWTFCTSRPSGLRKPAREQAPEDRNMMMELPELLEQSRVVALRGHWVAAWHTNTPRTLAGCKPGMAQG